MKLGILTLLSAVVLWAGDSVSLTNPLPIAKPIPRSEASAAYSVLKKEFRGPNFFNEFDFHQGIDRNNGFVRYAHPESAARSKNLIFSGQEFSYIKPDNKNVQWEGRDSVRIVSKARFGNGLYIFNIHQMPGGECGIWPALYTLSVPWPKNGEIDIIEGVNQATHNSITLHTTPGCSTILSHLQTGHQETGDCSVSAPGQHHNQGCQTHDRRSQSYGRGFNARGGGYYAMERTNQHIKVWFFPRGTQPRDLTSMRPEPRGWGAPVAWFGGACDIEKFFAKNHAIVIQTNFCGDWAGGVFDRDCPGRGGCANFVAKNPRAFEDMYWKFEWIRVFSS